MSANIGFEAGDQRNVTKEDVEEAKREARFHEGKENSHKANDPRKWHRSMLYKIIANPLLVDQRSIANRLEREEKVRFNPSITPNTSTHSYQ